MIPEADLALIATESSDNERRASEAERELVEWKKLKFMRDRVGEDFSAMILSATKYGLFVELDDLFVEGLVALQSLGALDNDYYTYRENTREIIGERWGRRFRVGQRARVMLERVDATAKRLQFAILLEEGSEHRAQGTEKQGSGIREQGAGKSKKSGKDKKTKGSESSVPAFARNVAQPGKKSRGKRAKTSMQRQGGKPHPFPKKSKKGKKRK
jgi:ribonuclease R